VFFPVLGGGGSGLSGVGLGVAVNDWADDKARDWIDARGGLVVSDDYCIESLAALLREVAEDATAKAIRAGLEKSNG